MVIIRKLLWDKNYFMMSVKQAAGAVGIWAGDNWDVKRVNHYILSYLVGSISKVGRVLIRWVVHWLSGFCTKLGVVLLEK